MLPDALEEGALPFEAGEIDELEGKIRLFRSGQMTPEKFRAFRLMQGIYGQRQADHFMVRIKVPFGGLTDTQLETLARASEEFTPKGTGHITTRQDIQFHFVRLERVPELLRFLGKVGLTSREGCGNTVRNVTACSLAGVCQREAFDVAPYAAAVGSHFLRSPLVQALPRKFKIAFSGCATDCAYAPVHDVGAIAVLREEGNTLHRGFRIFVGGGLGAIPRLGEVLSDFLPEEELVPTIEAILRVFNRLGERGNREHARMKFLLRRLGVEEFRRLVGEELRQIEASSRRFYWPPVAGASGESTAPQAPWEPGVASPEFQRWMETNVVPQKQPGYFAVHIVVPLGDLTADQFRALADMARDFALGEIRTTNQQDIVLPWVRGESLLRLYEALIKAALGSPGAGRVCDVTCCQGADTCSVGLTRSKGLARALLDELQKRGDSHTLAVKIKMSGCPHSCGQHHIADIGLHGCAVHNNGRLAPCYQLLMGGGIGDKGARLVQPVMKIPSKRVPAAISRVLDYYREAHLSGEGFTDFFWRVGVEEIRERLSDFKVLPRIEEDPMSYVDWGAFTLFTLEERGEGECAV